jgi:Bacterial Ig-like domain (group 2)
MLFHRNAALSAHFVVLCMLSPLLAGWASASSSSKALTKGNCPSLDGQSTRDIAPPSNLHWIHMQDRIRLVFSRSEDDTVDRRDVSHYVVCWGSHDCESTSTNYIDFSRSVAPTELRAVAFAVSINGSPSCGSQVSRLNPELTIDKRLPSTENARASAGPEAQCYSEAPSKVYSPFFGPLVKLTGSSNKTTAEWGFWQHDGSSHGPGAGINSADDTYAWDVNLNLNVADSANNMDVGMDFFAAGYGTAVKWGGKAPGADSFKSVLIDHCGWFSGYLHGTSIRPKTGDYLTPWTAIGKVSRSGLETNPNDHLHFAVYRGTNTSRGLVSYNATILSNTLVILTARPSLRVGQSASLAAVAERAHAAQYAPDLNSISLNSSSVVKNTYWISSNPRIVTVDGNGKLTGKAKGSATVTLYYSGLKKTTTVSIN